MFSLDVATLSFLLDHIVVGSLKNTFIELIGKLIPKKVMHGHGRS